VKKDIAVWLDTDKKRGFGDIVQGIWVDNVRNDIDTKTVSHRAGLGATRVFFCSRLMTRVAFVLCHSRHQQTQTPEKHPSPPTQTDTQQTTEKGKKMVEYYAEIAKMIRSYGKIVAFNPGTNFNDCEFLAKYEVAFVNK